MKTYPFNCTFTLTHLFVLIFFQPLLCDLADGLSQGDPCTIEENHHIIDYGICLPLRDCPSAIEIVQNRGYPTLCGFHGRESIVCCQGVGPDPVRPVTDRPTEAPSTSDDYQDGSRVCQQKCDGYSRVKEKRFIPLAVVGGTKAEPREFPHMAAVGYGEENNKQWFCGGTLISERFILTAAHCLDTDYGKPKYARLGDLDLATTIDDGDAQEFKIVQSIANPGYQYPSNYHDIGLMKLDRNVIFGAAVLPACLFVGSNEDRQGLLTITGWGQTGFTEAASNTLMKAPLAITPADECNRDYKTTSRRFLERGIDKRTQICAAGRRDEQVKDACLGDSGGPLSVKKLVDRERTQMFHVLGVTSFGKACGVRAIPGVYTRVSYYVPWIENIVWRR